MAVKPIPEGYEGATPYIICKGASRAIEFYKKAFGATELYRMEHQGKVGHAQIKIAGAIIMLADEFPEMGASSPQTIGGSPVRIYIYVPNIDAFAKRAIDAGAKVLRPLSDQFYGDRSVMLEDPFGHLWAFATHVEDVSPEEIDRRAAAKFGAG